MLFLFLLGLFTLPYSQTPGPAAADTAPAAARSDTAAFRDTSGADSLRQGKAAGADSLSPRGNNDLWLGFSFLIPNVPEFSKLRSAGENQAVATAMDADARARFDNNDIAFPLELGFLHRWRRGVTTGAGLGYWRIHNRAAWNPKAGDSVITRRFVNTYRFQAVPVSAWLRAEVPPALWTADRFNRIYLRGGILLIPWARLSTERTELHRRVEARGLGIGGEVTLGLEKFLSPATSLTGELGYAWVRFSHWREGDAQVREEDLSLSGTRSPLALTFRNLGFHFTYTVWRPGT